MTEDNRLAQAVFEERVEVLQCHEKCCFDCNKREDPCESVCCDILSGDTPDSKTCDTYRNGKCEI